MLISLILALLFTITLSLFLEISKNNIIISTIISLIVVILLEKSFKVNKVIKNYIINFNILYSMSITLQNLSNHQFPFW